MKRKFGFLAVAFIVAVGGVFATKASRLVSYVALSNCSTPIAACVGSGANCGYVQGFCTTIIQKNP